MITNYTTNEFLLLAGTIIDRIEELEEEIKELHSNNEQWKTEEIDIRQQIIKELKQILQKLRTNYKEITIIRYN